MNFSEGALMSILFTPPKISSHILEEMAARSALANLNRPALQALRDAGEGRSLTTAQCKTLERGWNGSLFDVQADRLTRLGEMAYNLRATVLAVPERQSLDVTSSEREIAARDIQRRQEYREQQQVQRRSRQLQSRNIAQREESRDEVEALTKRIDELKAAGYKLPKPKRDRGLER